MKYKVLTLFFFLSVITSFRSNAQWSRVNSVPALDIVAFAETHNILFAASDSNLVYKSVDGGTTWNPTSIGNNSIRIITLTIIDDTIYAGTNQHGIIRSSDFGLSWTNTGNALLSITGIIKAGNNLYASSLGNGVYKYDRQINNWVPFNNLLPSYSVNVNSIIDAGGTPLIGAGANGTTYLLDSISHFWIEGFYYGILRPGLQIQQLKKDSNTIFAVNWNRLMISHDNGLTWSDDNFDATNGYSRTFYTGSQKNYIVTNVMPVGTWIQQRVRNSPLGSSWANDEEFVPGGYAYEIIEFENKLFLGKSDGLYVKGISTSIESGGNVQEENFQIKRTENSSLMITADVAIKKCVVLNAAGQNIFVEESNNVFTTQSLTPGFYIVDLFVSDKTLVRKIVME